MTTPVRHVKVKAGEQLSLQGSIVLRGEVERGGSIEVLGDLKIGRLLTLGSPSSFHCLAEDQDTGGNLLVSKRVSLPSTISLSSERNIKLLPETFPSQGVFDNIVLAAPKIDLRDSAPLKSGQRLSIRSSADDYEVYDPKRLSGTQTRLRLLEADGYHVSISPFGSIEATSLTNFSHLRGDGLQVQTLRVGYLSEATVRGSRISISRGDRTLIFFPLEADLGDPPSFRFMFAPSSEDYRLPIADLLSRYGVFNSKINIHEMSNTESASAESGGVGLVDCRSDGTKSEGDGSFVHDGDEIVRSMEGEDKSDLKLYLRRLYEKMINYLLHSSGQLTKSSIYIDILDSAKSDNVIAGHGNTKVYVQAGDLEIGEICEGGVVINVSSGDVRLKRDFFPTKTDSQLLSPTIIRASNIYLPSLPASKVKSLGIRLIGNLYVDGVRLKSLEASQSEL